MICAVIERFFYSPILLVRHFQLAHDALTRIKLTVKSRNQRPFQKLQTSLALDILHD